jgi:predicted nucleic acid binding AN1-type Zn finger protein
MLLHTVENLVEASQPQQLEIEQSKERVMQTIDLDYTRDNLSDYPLIVEIWFSASRDYVKNTVTKEHSQKVPLVKVYDKRRPVVFTVVFGPSWCLALGLLTKETIFKICHTNEN